MSAKKGRLGFSTKASLRREPIPNMSNLKEGFCHKNYALWRKKKKKNLNGLSFNLQSFREWVYQEGEKKGNLLMHVSIPTTCVSLIFVCSFSFLSFFFISLPLLPFNSFIPLLLFTTTTFYTICHDGIYYFYPSIAFGYL